MANEGVKDSNGSQFFFTLGPTPELQGVNTMFGRVEGDTIYNLMKMAEAGEMEEEGSERPMYPTKVTGAEVVANPFEDVVARVREAPRVKGEGEAEGEGKGVRKRKKGVAGKNVLSFGGGEEEGEEMVEPVRKKKKTKANPMVISVGVEEVEDSTVPATAKEKKKKKGVEKPAQRRRSPSRTPDSESDATPPPKPVPSPSTKKPAAKSPSPSPSTSPEPLKTTKPTTTTLAQTNAEIASLKASMKRSNTSTLPSAPSEPPKNALEAMIPASSTRGRKRGKVKDERGALDIFRAFKQRLDDIPAVDSERGAEKPAPAEEAETNGHATAPENAEEDEEAGLCDLHFIAHCQSCKNWDDHHDQDAVDADREGEGEEWMAHQLSFAKDTLGKDLEWKRKMAEIEVIDPREKAKVIKEEGRKEKKERGGKERERVGDKGRV